MSKSKGNVVNPDDVVNQYGADVFRMYEMFIGPFDQDAPWDTNGIEGVKRFLEKVWKLQDAVGEGKLEEKTETLLHQTLKKVGEDIDGMHFNTAVSAMMILVNGLLESTVVSRNVWEIFLKMLAPFAPHLAEELWSRLGQLESIHVSAWPAYDSTKLQNSTFELVIQVNGKVREKIIVSSDISEEDAKARALASEKIQGYLGGKEPQKVVYVKGRLISISV
jgi:leucyl-tRNA synthetase